MVIILGFFPLSYGFFFFFFFFDVFGFTKMESKFNLVLDVIIHDLYERRSD